ncbi:DUF2752 domain-containing protein [Hufsiella ginkgonis]|uniref:DUF2752 domain-containing protein n=1 Tax=Hufsiella ginkgonis TaxID=2695274 RepID=A0A7K1XT12_9SPHI|nr:DUF2752 domain-containing protein [Hufsiella ginkgonis]MXV14143.1 DUF2752 domain-containing protein [Hufsiella ginkgonis]
MLKRFPFELVCWLGGLLFLAVANPGETHFTVCPLALAGLNWCPGCGLGRSVSALLHGDLRASFGYHWLGLPATVILTHRILILFKNYLNSLRIYA